MFEVTGIHVHAIPEHFLLAYTSTAIVAKKKMLSCTREYQNEEPPRQLPETDRPRHRPRFLDFRKSRRRSTYGKQAVYSRMVGVAFLSLCSLAAAQDGGGTCDNPSTPANSVHQGATRHRGSDPVILYVSLLLILGSFFGGIWIFTRDVHYNTFKKRKWLWLMAFAATIAWWVVSALAEPPSTAGKDNDGRLLAISLWIFFFALYASQSHRLVRQGHQLILTSLVGSILTTVLLAAYCEHVSNDRRLRGRGMQGFAVQALAVEPFSLTIWVRVVTTALQNIVSRAQESSTDGATAASAPV